jgi:hypothetical protein
LELVRNDVNEHKSELVSDCCLTPSE